MKSILCTLVFLLLSVPLIAQKANITHDSFNISTHKPLFSYTDYGSLSKNYEYLPDSVIRTGLFGGVDLIRFKKIFTHDFNGNEVESIEFTDSNMFLEWDSLYKNTTTFTAFNKPIQKISYSYDENLQQWENENKRDFLYDGFHNITEMIISNWNFSIESWNAYNRIEYLYNSSILDKKYTWVWDSDIQDWKPYFRQDYFYDNNNLTTTINNRWVENTQEWILSHKAEYFYDSNFNISLINYYQWDINTQEWVFQYDLEFFYNSNDQLFKKIRGGYQTQKNDYTYYSHGNLKQEDISDWNHTTENWDWHDRYIWYYTLQEVASVAEDDINDFIIFPNPAKNIIQFQTNKDIQIEQLSIYDIQGKEVSFKTQFENNKLNISELSAGIYIYKIQYQNATQTGKIVIKR